MEHETPAALNSPIESAVGILRTRLSVLNSNLIDLQTRLDPALTPAPPQMVEKAGAAPTPPRSELTSALHELIGTVENISTHIVELTSRVEL